MSLVSLPWFLVGVGVHLDGKVNGFVTPRALRIRCLVRCHTAAVCVVGGRLGVPLLATTLGLLRVAGTSGLSVPRGSMPGM